MPNPSPGLIKFFKRKSYGRIWALKSSYDRKGFISLKKLKDMSLRNVQLRVGSPTAFGANPKYKEDGKVTKCRAFSGTEMRGKMFHGRSQGDVCHVGIGHKSTGTWMIDVTDKVIESLNEIGACSISRAHCQFELISPRVKKCKFCGDKLYKKTKRVKQVNWNYPENQ